MVNFWSCECPHSERTDRSLMACFIQWEDHVALLNIASNRNEDPKSLKETAQAHRLPIVLHDSDCTVADLYGAQCTPHAFVIDRLGVLRYAGAVDNVAFRQRTATRFYVEEAVEALLEERLPSTPEQPPFGCAITRSI